MIFLIKLPFIEDFPAMAMFDDTGGSINAISLRSLKKPREVLFSGKRLHDYGKSPFRMEQLTMSMAIFNSYISHYQRVLFF